MQRWSYFLKHRPFVLRIDNQALKWIKTMAEPVGMIQRWLDILATYDFTVQHRAGKSHQNADSLSRINHADPADESSDVSMGEHIALINNTPSTEATSPYTDFNSGPPKLTMDLLREEQRIDDDLFPVLHQIVDPTEDRKPRYISPTAKVYWG